MVVRALLVIASICAGALVSVCGAALSPIARGCVYDGRGEPHCTRLEEKQYLLGELISVARPVGDCDDVCMQKKAVDITNKIRCKYGECTKVKAGPMVMLDNAKDWSKKQMRSGMKHQKPLPKLRCGINVMAENVAMFGGFNPDPAEQCMKQWENSKGHRDNILAAKPGSMVAVGFYKEGTKVYCTQTFTKWKKEEPGGGGSECVPLSDQSPSNGPSPTVPVATEPVVTNPPAIELITTEPAPVVTKPPATEPVTEPVVTEAVATEPVIIEPVDAEPVVTEPAATEPVITDPVMTEPVLTDPAVTASPVITFEDALPETDAPGTATEAPAEVQKPAKSMRKNSPRRPNETNTNQDQLDSRRKKWSDVWKKMDARRKLLDARRKKQNRQGSRNRRGRTPSQGGSNRRWRTRAQGGNSRRRRIHSQGRNNRRRRTRSRGRNNRRRRFRYGGHTSGGWGGNSEDDSSGGWGGNSEDDWGFKGSDDSDDFGSLK